MEDLEKRVYQYMQGHHMVMDGETVILGVSGGSDSMGLLTVFHELSKIFSYSLVVVHVNHGMRGREADADQAYVSEICREWDIPCYTFYVDLKRFAQKEGMSIEEAGRFYRYQCFEKVRKEVGGQKIAVAHQQEDASETVLLNLFRGTGLRGLCGIPPVRDVIIRPLLCVGRSDIEAYLEKKNMTWRVDASNLSDAYTRNRIRNHIMPFVEHHIQASAGQHIQEMSELLRDIAAYIDQQALVAFDACVVVGENPLCRILENPFKMQDVVIQRELIRRVFHICAGKLKDIDKEHVEMVRGLMEKNVGRRYSLPYQLQAIRTYDGISFKKDVVERETIVYHDPVWIEGPGQYLIPETDQMLVFSVKERCKNEEIPINLYTKWFDYDKIKNTMSVRTRENGDFLSLNPEGHRKLLKRWMIDEKIPKEQRDHIFFLADGNHVMWIFGYRISENYKVTEETKRILVAEIKGEKDHGR